MLICTFKVVPGAFLFRAQNSLSPSYKKPTAVVFSIGAGTTLQFRHASSPVEVQSYSLLAEKSMQTSIISGRHRDKGCFSKLSELLFMAV